MYVSFLRWTLLSSIKSWKRIISVAGRWWSNDFKLHLSPLPGEKRKRYVFKINSTVFYRQYFSIWEQFIQVGSLHKKWRSLPERKRNISVHLTQGSYLTWMIESLQTWEQIHYLQERSEALATVPPLSALVGSSRVSPSFLLVAREDQSFIQPVKAGRSTAIYKVHLELINLGL